MQHVWSVYTNRRVDIREKKKKKIYPCGGQVVFGWGASIVSWIECVVPIFPNLFEMKSFIKVAFSPPSHLFHFLSSSLLEYSWRSLAGQNTEVSISNRALVSIKSPGVSPKIHTFCRSLGREREWMEVSRGSSEEEVFKATGGLLPRGFSGRRAFSSDPRQPSPGAEITKDCLNLQKRRCGPEATACELTN